LLGAAVVAVSFGVAGAALVPTPAAPAPQDTEDTVIDPRIREAFDNYPSEPLPKDMPPIIRTVYTTLPDGTVVVTEAGDPVFVDED